jgi:hypothetical protein
MVKVIKSHIYIVTLQNNILIPLYLCFSHFIITVSVILFTFFSESHLIYLPICIFLFTVLYIDTALKFP